MLSSIYKNIHLNNGQIPYHTKTISAKRKCYQNNKKASWNEIYFLLFCLSKKAMFGIQLGMNRNINTKYPQNMKNNNKCGELLAAIKMFEGEILFMWCFIDVSIVTSWHCSGLSYSAIYSWAFASCHLQHLTA